MPAHTSKNCPPLPLVGKCFIHKGAVVRMWSIAIMGRPPLIDPGQEGGRGAGAKVLSSDPFTLPYRSRVLAAVRRIVGTAGRSGLSLTPAVWVETS